MKRSLNKFISLFVAFIMILSSFSGTISFADTKSEDVKVKFEIVVDEKEASYNQLGLVIEEKGSDRQVDLTDDTKLTQGKTYSLEYNTKILKLKEFYIGGTEIVPAKNKYEFKVDEKATSITLDMNFELVDAKKVDFEVDVDGTEFFLNQLGIELVGDSKYYGKDSRVFNKGENYSYLKQNYEYKVKYDELNYNLKSIKVDDKEFTNDKFEITEETKKIVFNFEYSHDKAMLELNFTAPEEVEKHIKVITDIEGLELNEKNIIPRGKYKLEFVNVLKGYDIVIKDFSGVEVLNKEKKNSSIKFDLNVYKNSKIDFGVTNEKFQVLANAPKAKEESFTVYSTPDTEVKGRIIEVKGKASESNDNFRLIEEFKTTTNKDGKGTVKLTERTAKNDIIYVTAEYNDIYSINSVKVSSEDTEDIDLSIKVPKSKDISISGVTDGEKAKAYIYNIESKEFRDIAEVLVEENSFTIELDNPVVNNDKLYIKGMNDGNDGAYTEAIAENLAINLDVERLSGIDRYETSLKIAEESYEKADKIILANGYKSADVLSAGPYANELNAPILLVNNDEIRKDILDYIKNAGVKNIFIIGGENSISKNLVKRIEKDTDIEATRIAGVNRFETSMKIAESLIKDHKYNNEVILANGFIDADALATSTYATINKKPLVLTEDTRLPNLVRDGLEALGVEKVEIVGGKKTISDKILNKTEMKITERIAGEDRYATSLEIAKKLDGNFNSVIIANGYRSADSLTAGSLAYTKKAAILLTEEKSVKKSHSEYIEEKFKNESLEYIYIVGGNNSINESVSKQLKKIIKK